MASVYTQNLAVEEPGSGDYAGTWNTPVNSNMVIFDSAIGTIQQIDLTAGSVTLSTAQARSAFLNFVGTLGANATVTVPGLSSAPGTTISGKGYTLQNRCANSSVYTITLATTVAGRESICLPPYEPTDVLIEGSNSSNAGAVRFRNLGRVGTLWDYAGSSVPNWVSGCTIPPYLNCDGTSFSSATYPTLSIILGGTTLPDARGRFRATLNQTTGRITSGSSTGGVDGNTNLASGGSQTTTLSSQNVPPTPISITDPGHLHAIHGNSGTYVGGGGVTSPLSGSFSSANSSNEGNTDKNTTGISATVGNASPTNFSNVPPSYICGLTLIRSA